jgi:hypothetical protein
MKVEVGLDGTKIQTNPNGVKIEIRKDGSRCRDLVCISNGSLLVTIDLLLVCSICFSTRKQTNLDGSCIETLKDGTNVQVTDASKVFFIIYVTEMQKAVKLFVWIARRRHHWVHWGLLEVVMKQSLARLVVVRLHVVRPLQQAMVS